MSGHHHHHDHDHTEPPSDLVLRVKALESLLVEKGLVDPAALDLLIDTYETKIGPRNGASVVARAWSDLAFKKWLLDDATAVAVEETEEACALDLYGRFMGFEKTFGADTAWIGGVEAFDISAGQGEVAAEVADPLGVLKEFGTELEGGIEVRVWDSTSEVRYLVLPERPAGTEGWSEEQLAGLVTRNSMIGVEKARSPQSAGS